MSTRMREDLRRRFAEAHRLGRFVVPISESDAHRLQDALRHGRVVSPARRVYALPDYLRSLNPLERERQKLVAQGSLHPTWVFAGFSAAVLHGLYVPYAVLGPTYVGCLHSQRSRSTHDVRRITIASNDVVRAGNLCVTSITRTAFDCTRASRFVDALGFIDSTLRVTGMPRMELTSTFHHMSNAYAHKWRAVEASRFGDPRADNGGESFTRATIIALGYQIPDLQREIFDPLNTWQRYYVDFYWELGGGNVAGELDGIDKYADPRMTGGRGMAKVFSAERLRESRLTGANMKVMRFSISMVRDREGFRRLLDTFGIPGRYAIPHVARTSPKGIRYDSQ